MLVGTEWKNINDTRMDHQQIAIFSTSVFPIYYTLCLSLSLDNICQLFAQANYFSHWKVQLFLVQFNQDFISILFQFAFAFALFNILQFIMKMIVFKDN